MVQHAAQAQCYSRRLEKFPMCQKVKFAYRRERGVTDGEAHPAGMEVCVDRTCSRPQALSVILVSIPAALDAVKSE